MNAPILEADRRRARLAIAWNEAVVEVSIAEGGRDPERLAQAYANHRAAYKALQDFRVRECEIYRAEMLANEIERDLNA